MELGSLSYIKPEIAIAITLLLIVLFDLIFHRDKRIIPYIAVIGIIIAGYFTIQQFGMKEFAFKTGGSNFGMIAIDSFGAFFKLLVLLATLFIIFFSYQSEEIKKIFDRTGEYYALIFGLLLGMIVMISATDLILIYISLELMSLSSYVLTGFTKLRLRNSEASLKYLIYGAVSSGSMLFGISLLYGMTGSTNLYVLNSLIQNPQISLFTFAFAMILILAGMGYKISVAPFHFWTPDVYEGAPITITAYLSVASKAAGFAMLIRFIYITFVSYTSQNGNWHLIPLFDWRSILIVISVLTMTLGNFTALWQDNLKRMLAYSSIAHAGYILLGLVVFTTEGLSAMMIYFFFYLLMNLGAFFIVMIIANKTKSEDVHDYDGLGYISPFLSISLAIFLISLMGIPPTAGFIGKLFIFLALINAKMVILALIALVNTLVSVYYYARVIKHMFFAKPPKSIIGIHVSFNVIIITLLLLIPTLLFGIYFTPIANLAKSCAVILGL